MKPLLIAAVLIVTVESAVAQGDAVLSGLDWIPQQLETLPHRRPVGTGFLALPEANAVWSTNWLQPAQWLETNEEGTTLNLNAFVNGLHDDNRWSTDLRVNWIGFGRAVGPARTHFITGNATEVVRADVTLPGDVLRLPFVGNLNAPTIAGEGLALRLDHVRRYTLGWQAQWTPRWSTGVRLHHLRGLEHAELREVELNVSTDEEDFSWEFSGAAVLETAGLARLFDSIDGNTALEQGASAYLNEVGSPGWGVDVGGAFAPNERWLVEASFTGLGRIAWNREVWNARWEADPLAFDGMDLGAWALDSGALEDSMAMQLDQWTAWADAALAAEESSASFASTLPGVWLGQIQRRSPNGHTAQFTLRHSAPYGTTCSAGATVPMGRLMQVNSTYTHGRGVRALGAGFALRLGGLLFHTTVDNVLAARVAQVEWGNDRSILLPIDASRLHVRAGMSWIFGRPRKPVPEPRMAPSTRHPGGTQAAICPDFQ